MLLAEGGQRGEDGDPWNDLAGFRAGAPTDLAIALSHGGETRMLRADDGAEEAFGLATPHGNDLIVFWQGQAFAFSLPGVGGGSAAGAASDGSLISPMPGRVIGVDVRQGDAVTKGQKLLTLEAMKMEHSLAAPFDGIVAELNATEGAQVTEGTLLARIEKGEGE
jgi:3-methylcrotonyl-CoA carboxylase alpha subunit